MLALYDLQCFGLLAALSFSDPIPTVFHNQILCRLLSGIDALVWEAWYGAGAHRFNGGTLPFRSSTLPTSLDVACLYSYL